MIKRVIGELSKYWLLVLGLLWVLLWVLPWADWLHSNWLCLGISIGIFIVPGMIISMLLMNNRLSLFGHISSGIAVSVFLISALGLLGRLLHYPFDLIKPMFVLVGLGGIVKLDQCYRFGKPLYKSDSYPILVLALLLLIIVVGVVIVIVDVRFGGDDQTYLAYVTNFQHAHPLNFEEPIFGSGKLDRIRFWIAMFPMNLAFLAELSHIHAILLFGFYLSPFFIIFGVLSIFVLYEDFFPSKYQAISALLLQFTIFLFMRTTIGGTFFLRLIEDKGFAAFILAPIFFLAVHHFLESFSWRTGLFVVLVGLGLSLTHTIIFAYSIFVAGVYSGLYTMFVAKNFRKLLISIALLATLIFPSSLLRFADVPSAPNSFDLDSALEQGSVMTRITYIDGTPFYGLNLSRIRMPISNKIKEPYRNFLTLSFLWITIAGFVWSLFFLKENSLAPFTAATSVLILLCVIPYTGWLMGYLVTARMLWRAPWLLPGGMIGTGLLVELFSLVWRKLPARFQVFVSGEQVALGLILVASVILSTTPAKGAFIKLDNYSAGSVEHRNNLARLAAFGDFLEEYIDKPSRVFAPNALMTYLPGLSSKPKVFFFRSFRYTGLIAPPSLTQELEDSKKFRSIILSSSTKITIDERINLLREYKIQYILDDSTALKDYYSLYPEYFDLREFGDYWVAKLK